MKSSNQKCFTKRVLRVGITSVFATLLTGPMVAHAESVSDDLIQAGSVIEVGAGSVSRSSAAYGEYNGLDANGVFAIGNIDLRGGDGKESAFRWRVVGTDLGLDTRNIQGEVGTQGVYRLNAGHDEIVHNTTDEYETIYRGVGSNRLKLPPSYPAATTRLSSTANQNGALSNWANPQSPYATSACAATGGVPSENCRGPGYLIPQTMHNPGTIGTERSIDNLGFSWVLAPGLELKGEAKRDHKDGTQLTGFGMNGPGRGLMLPEPVDSVTDNYESRLVYTIEKGYLSAGYAGSTYKDDIDLWTVENPFQNNSLLNNTAQLQGPPDNQMNQFNLSGGYNFTPQTKLVMAGHYTRMTQDDDFDVNYPSPTYLIPESSADAKVINTSYMSRLTSQVLEDLNLSAAYAYDYRDNQTPHEIFVVPGSDNPGTPRTFENEPYNRQNQRFNLDADYSIDFDKNLNVGYEWQSVDFSANEHGEVPMPSDGNHENTFHVDYQQNITESLVGQAGLSHSERRMDDAYEDGDPMPLSPVVPEEIDKLIEAGKVTMAMVNGMPQYTAVAPYGFPAADPLAPDFRMFFLADRNRDKGRGSLNYQVNEDLALSTIFEYNKDEYPNSQYGLQNSDSVSASLDATYLASETLTFNVFYTYEQIKAEMDQQAILRTVVANPEVKGSTSTTLIAANTATVCKGSTLPSGSPANNWTDPCRRWSMEQKSIVDTVGLGFKSLMMESKLTVTGDLTYSHARTPTSFSGGTYTSNGNTGAGTQLYYSAEDLPDITSTMIDFHLSATYDFTKVSAVRVDYFVSRLQTDDFQYEDYEDDPTWSQSFIGTNMGPKEYETIHAVGVSYLYKFE